MTLALIPVCVAIVVALLLLVHRSALNLLHPRPRRALDAAPADAELLAGAAHLALRADDGMPIAGRVLQPAAARASVVLLHGLAEDHTRLWPRACALYRAGLRAVLLDLRGHGAAERATVSYGHREASDIELVLDWLEREYPGDPVGLWGHSYGGAVAIEAAANDGRVRGVVVEAVYADLDECVTHWGARLHRLPAWVCRLALAWAGYLGRFDPRTRRPVELAARMRCPAQCVVGTRDPYLPRDAVQRIFEAIPGPKQLLLAEGAGHFDIARVLGYEPSVRFLEGALGAEDPCDSVTSRSRVPAALGPG
jgi:pimeloyl-ACP methyl ester carboxylesterase